MLTVRNQKSDAMNALITKEAGYVGSHSDTAADVESWLHRHPAGRPHPNTRTGGELERDLGRQRRVAGQSLGPGRGGEDLRVAHQPGPGDGHAVHACLTNSIPHFGHLPGLSLFTSLSISHE